MIDVLAEFESIVKTHSNSMYRLLIAYCRNTSDAEDILQNTFLKLYQSNKVFKSEVHIKNWLYMVAVNEAKNVKKNHWSNYKEIPEEIVFHTPEQKYLYEEIERLSDKLRIVILLYYYEEYSIREIAKILQIKESAVQTRLQRARERLEEFLKEEQVSGK